MDTAHYEFLPEVFLRAPFYSYEDYNLPSLSGVLNKREFRNAIYLASPDFHAVLEKKDFKFEILSDKEKFSLYKYYNRMCFRQTPFGSFASFTNLKWANEQRIELSDSIDSILHLLPDQKVNDVIRKYKNKHGSILNLALNPTCYLVGEEFRFVRTNVNDKGQSEFTLASISAEGLNLSIVDLFKKKNLTYDQFILWVSENANCNIEDGKDYADFLLEEQLIFTEYQGHVISHTEQKDIHRAETIFDKLLPIQSFWQNWKNKRIGDVDSVPSASDTIKVLLDNISEKVKSQHFYASVERPLLKGGLNENDQDAILDAINFSAKISASYTHPNLEKFITSFKERFNEEKIPLLVALDPDAGVGYGDFINEEDEVDLLKGVHFPNKETSQNKISWSKLHQIILKIWTQENKNRYQPISITEKHIEHLNEDAVGRFPSTISILFRKENGKILLDSAGGATATSIIGRFTEFSQDVVALCRKLATSESMANEDVIFADIGQLSNSHIDNINRRAAIYDYEIPINVYSNLPFEKQIKPYDLLISVRDNELILESAVLKKRIIPRFTTAYNSSKTDLAIFRFLVDLQYQNFKSAFSFDLENLFPNLGFYPAVEYGKVQICCAKWVFDESLLAEIKQSPKSEHLYKVKNFRLKYGLPRCVMLGDFDQQLVFDLENNIELEFFVDCIKNEKKVTLKEFNPPGKEITTNDGPMVGQFIAFLKSNEKIYSDSRVRESSTKVNVPRNFLLGSSWLYLKFFCTPQSANSILNTVITPILTSHQQLFKKWFFIRYTEKGNHIRVRFKVSEGQLGKLLEAIENELNKGSSAQLIKSYEANTYQREIERYGYDLINEVEDFFYAGSELIIKHLDIDSLKPASDFDFGLMLMYQMLNIGLPDLNDQIRFCETVSNSFLKEFAADKLLKRDIDNKYRELKTNINHILQEDKGSDMLTIYFSKLGSLLDLVADNNRRESLLSDMIHMQLNRLFSFQQRKQEMILYYFLLKFLTSQKAKTRSITTSQVKTGSNS